MKNIVPHSGIFLVIGFVLFTSCKKETQDPTVPNNHPPVANASEDHFITLPLNTVTLDGSGSTDPDNNITSYAWAKIKGPTFFNISIPTAAFTTVTDLVEGVYQFELKVMDAGGLFSKDTLQVTVVIPVLPCDPGNRPLVNAQLVPIGNLSQARQTVAIASAGNKILFAGGAMIDFSGVSRVDIYDILTNTWATAELSQARTQIGTATLENKIFFAGGVIPVPHPSGSVNSWGDIGIRSSRIDIYDASLNSWSTAELSEARSPIGAAAGNKVVFAGNDVNGRGSDRKVDIYDASDKTWSTAELSEGRQVNLATTAGNKIYFSGGRHYDYLSSRIDIYDATTNSWTVSSFDQTWDPGGIAVDNKIYWAGGQKSADNDNFILTNEVLIKDVNNQTFSQGCLFQLNGSFQTVLTNNKIVFFTGLSGVEKNKFDIYDISTNTWSIGLLSQNIQGAAIISVNNTIYVAGGYVNGVLSNQVWKLEF